MVWDQPAISTSAGHELSLGPLWGGVQLPDCYPEILPGDGLKAETQVEGTGSVAIGGLDGNDILGTLQCRAFKLPVDATELVKRNHIFYYKDARIYC